MLSAILWRNSVRFGKNFSDGAILEVIFLESRSKSSHLGCREGVFSRPLHSPTDKESFLRQGNFPGDRSIINHIRSLSGTGEYIHK
jgi:hypothetical protein